MDDFGTIGVFDDIFHIRLRFKNTKIWLYGLDEDVKRAFSLLAYFNITITGFLLPPKQRYNFGREYMGKPVIEIDDVLEELSEKSIIVDIYGKKREEIKKKTERFDILFQSKESNILIHGFGECGKKAIEFFEKTDLHIRYIVDKDLAKKGTYHHIEIISPNETLIKKWMNDAFVIIAIDNENIRKDLIDFYNKLCMKSTYFNMLFYECNYTKTIWVKNENAFLPIFKTWCLRYIDKVLGKKVYLYSANTDYSKKVLIRLKKIGYRSFGIAVYDEEKHIIKLYENEQNRWKEIDRCSEAETIIWILAGEEKNAKKISEKNRNNTRFQFLYSINAPLKYDREYILDTQLGYGIKDGFKILKNNVNSDKILKIAILGDSTADCGLLLEKSWPEYFIEAAEKDNVKIECMVAAVCGYTSMQELIQLQRDIIEYRPDIVISYSIVNEISLSADRSFSTHIYQKRVYELALEQKEKINFYGLNINNEITMGLPFHNAADRWIKHNRMMNAICQDYGIRFFSILPPTLYTKEPKSSIDLELLEYMDVDRELLSTIADIQIRQKNYKWIYDFSNIFSNYSDETFFDYCHLIGCKNMLVAEKIFKIIQEELY